MKAVCFMLGNIYANLAAFGEAAVQTIIEQRRGRSALLILTAFAYESQQICQHYRLKRTDTFYPWVAYASPDSHIILIETGIGPIRAAACMGMLAPLCRAWPQLMLLNIGCAGSAEMPLHSMVSIQHAHYAATDTDLYVRPVKGLPVQRTLVTTVDCVSEDYAAVGVVDMEAAALILASESYVTREQWAILKCVTDTPDVPPNRDKVTLLRLFQEHMAVIAKTIDALLEISSQQCEHVPKHTVYDWQALASFSVTEARLLQSLLADAVLLLPENVFTDLYEACQKISRPGLILQHIQAALPRIVV